MTRLNANGSLDTSFDPGGPDGAGKKTIDYGGNDFGTTCWFSPTARSSWWARATRLETSRSPA